MAISTRQAPKKGKLKQMPSAVAVEEPPEPPPTPFDPEPPVNQQPEPPPNAAPDAQPAPQQRHNNKKDFFELVRKYPKEDWGTRIFLYLYCFEPICDEKLSGEKKYLNRFSEPVMDEQAIMVDYGSGKYRLTLTNRKPAGVEKGSPIETYDFEIYNPKYPPKLPRTVWKNDPRNARWEALLPKEAPPAAPATGLDTLLEAMRVSGDIRREIKEEMAPDTPAAPAAVVAAATVDPWTAAEKILNMRSENPMVTILQAQLAASAAAVEAERDRNFKAAEAARDREFKLQQQLMESAKSNGGSKGIVDQLLELAALGDKLDPLKKLFGFGSGEAVTTRAAKMGAYEMVRDLAQTPFGQQVGQGLGMLLGSLANRGAQANGQPVAPITPILTAQQPNGTAAPKETDEQRIQRIGQQITTPMLYEFFLKDLSGDTFAERMFDIWPEDYIFIKKLGAENLVARYRQFAPAWAVIAPKEPAFIEFIGEFCAWNPNAEDEAEAPPRATVTDLDEQEAANS